jgi:hypothetical protein
MRTLNAELARLAHTIDSQLLMEELLKMIQGVSIQEALALTVKEDIEETVAVIKARFALMTQDEILEYGLDNYYISVEDIDAVRI